MIQQNTVRVKNNASVATKLNCGEFSSVFELQPTDNNVILSTQVKWSLLDSVDKPVVVVLGGISANRYVGYGEESSPVFISENDTSVSNKTRLKGWWEDFIGSQGAINLEKYSVLSFDYIGGNTTYSQENNSQANHHNGSKTEYSQLQKVETLPITTYDQAEALNRILSKLNINTVHAIIGSSYGGMVSLAFSEKYPDKVKQQLVISAAAESHQRSRALRSIQRQIVKLSHQYNDVETGLALARQLGMITYRSIEEFEQRFSGADVEKNKLTDYLSFHGSKFARSFNASAFLTLSESIDNHRIDASNITTETTLVSVDTDELVFQSQIEALAQSISAKTQHHKIHSLYGHDAFLKEVSQLSKIIQNFLE